MSEPQLCLILPHDHHHDHKRVVLVDHTLGVRHERVECLGEDSVTNTRAASGLDPHGRRLERLSELQGLDDVIINASASHDTELQTASVATAAPRECPAKKLIVNLVQLYFYLPMNVRVATCINM